MSVSEAEPRRWRVVAGWVATGLAAALVLLALVTPDDFGHLTPAGFLSIPLEGLLGVALVLALPARWRPVAAVLAGLALGVLTLVKLLDLGFGIALARPFDMLSDWPLLRSGEEFLSGSIGKTGAVASVVGVGVLTVAVPLLMVFSMLRLSRVVARRRTAALRTVGALGVVWILLAVLGVHIVPGVPVAGWGTAALAYDHSTRLRAGLKDQEVFARELATDSYDGAPADRLLAGLRGKDVMLVFVESYGRVAIEHPDVAPVVDAALDAGTRRLESAGFRSRSGFLTSSTAGGGSWLAHSTFQSGLWVDSQRRYGDFLASDRLTLTRAFRDAGWRTVGIMPANGRDWPEGAIYGFDRIYDKRTLGYAGPGYAFSSPPDQHTLSAFHRLERGATDHPPVMAEVDLLSSHAPWKPIPQMLDWGSIGDGSGFTAPTGPVESASSVERADAGQVRTAYGDAVAYSMDSVVSYVENYGDDDLVVVVLGDHQPSPVVTGAGADRDVPISVIARDPAVFDRIAGWGWQNGLNPGPDAPVWRMDAFRNRFLDAFNG